MPDYSPLFGLSARLPPSNPQAEQALLGAILCNNRAYDLCAGLTAEHFADPVHAAIFDAARRRIEAGRKVDAVTLKGVFENTGVLDDAGGVGYLVQLITAMVAIDNAGDYARAIIDCALKRDMIIIGESLVNRAFGDWRANSAAEIGADALSALDEAMGRAGTWGTISMADAVDAALRQSESAHRGDRNALGLTTGIAPVDAQLGGLYPGELTIIGARSGEGKTAFALQALRHIAGQFRDESRGCAALWSMEVPAASIATVNLAALTGIPADIIRSGGYGRQQADELASAGKALHFLPLPILDGHTTLTQAIADMRKLRRTKGLRIAVLDHRDLFGREEERERMQDLAWMAHVTRTLKRAAKAIGIPIVLLVQLSRDIERREDKRPRKSDLMYAGEADADNIVLLYRKELHMGGTPEKQRGESEEQYGHRKWRHYQDCEAAKGKATAYFVKRRFGPPGAVELAFDGTRMTFAPLDGLTAG